MADEDLKEEILENEEDDDDFDEDEYLPEDSSIWERLLGPVAIALSIVALIGGIMAIMIQFNDTVFRKMVVASPQEKEEEEEPEMDVEENPVEIPTEETNEILQKDVEVSDHNETADEEDFSEAKGDPENASMVDFNLQSSLDTLGVGGGGGGRHGNRRGGRHNLVKGLGGGRRTESAVLAALRWLKRHQSSGGSWKLRDFSKECGKEGKRGRCDGDGDSDYDIGGSGLALLAYTGRGLDHMTVGEFQKTISKSMKFFKKIQKSDGAFGDENRGHFLYNQALATYAMADLLAMSEDDDLIPYVQKGIDYLLAAQNQGMGWRYANYNIRKDLVQEHLSEGGLNDTSVTTWAIMALKTAKEDGLKVDPKGYEGASNWLDKVFDGGESYNSPGTFGYTKQRAFVYKRPYGTTACGMLSRQFMKQNKGVSAGAETLMTSLPDWKGTRDLYYWYYGSLAMFQIGGEYWTKWNEAMKPALTKNIYNKKKDCLFGSWSPAGTVWGESFGGRVYTTAIAALTLEVYYRFLRIDEKAH
jgi:hypothetical protein